MFSKPNLYDIWRPRRHLLMLNVSEAMKVPPRTPALPVSEKWSMMRPCHPEVSRIQGLTILGFQVFLPGMVTPPPGATAAPSLLVQPASFFERLDLAALFPTSQPFEVELGCGDSTVIAELARRQPGHNFLGVERLAGRIRKLDRKGRRLGLTNLRGLRLEATYCLEYLLPPGSVSVLHVYFPDPWPKRKHWPRRLVNKRFPALAAQALEPGGRVYLRTDDAPYHQQMTPFSPLTPSFAPSPHRRTWLRSSPTSRKSGLPSAA